jgi:hypothetical protein
VVVELIIKRKGGKEREKKEKGKGKEKGRGEGRTSVSSNITYYTLNRKGGGP